MKNISCVPLGKVLYGAVNPRRHDFAVASERHPPPEVFPRVAAFVELLGRAPVVGRDGEKTEGTWSG